MKSLLISVFIILFTLSTQATEKFSVGVSKLVVNDEKTTRPLEGHIWYPTSDKQAEKLVGGNPVWHGFYAISEASVAQGSFPLVILSHGTFGNSQNQSWLATALAKSGYIVATPNHPGTSSFQRDPEARRQLWERPKDLSRTITKLLTTPRFSKSINKDKIIVMGHSLGGFDAMTLLGAIYNKAHHDKFCSTHLNDIGCVLLKKWAIATNEKSQKNMEASLADSRVSAAILFDLGGTQTFTKDNLATITRPILIIGAGNNSAGMNIEDESRALASALPKKNTQYIEPKDLTHFDFLGVCKPEAIAILKEEDPKDMIICKNGGERREIQHRLVIKHVFSFLQKENLF